MALGYGKYLVCIHVLEGSFGVEAYPLSTGKLTNSFDCRSEPMELLISPFMDIECKLVELER